MGRSDRAKASRRTFLKLSGALCGGLTLTSLLRMRAAAAPGQRRQTSVIFVQLGGGASQLETYDPKPDAPAEYRGAYGTVQTAVPGTVFSELMPQQAQLADRLSVIRSVRHHEASHIALHAIETGYFLQNSANARSGEAPSVGSVVSKLRWGTAPGLPESVSLPRPFAYSSPAWLGDAYNYFSVNSDPKSADFAVKNLEVIEKLSTDRLKSRHELLTAFEEARRAFDHSAEARSLDEFSAKAFELVTADKARDAFDITAEADATRDDYGRTTFGQRMLLARRLVEAGIPFVVVRMADWDDHKDLAARMKVRGADYDTGISALIRDLQQRGLNRDVLVVAMGEFGRTPRVNVNGGRDHWPGVASVMVSGGDHAMGQIVGGTDKHAGTVVAAPYLPQQVLALVYRHLGIDPATTFPDFSGRPRYILEEREPIHELA